MMMIRFRPILLLIGLYLLSVSPGIADDLTLVCDYCGKQITGDYIITDSGTYHEHCYEDHVAVRCAVCGQIIDGEYYTDYWGNSVHAHHKGVIPQCEYCGRFISDYTTGGGYEYRDGRIVCRLCDKTAIIDSSDARNMMREVSVILNSRGIEITEDDLPLHLVDKNEMAELRADEEGHPHGFTYARVTTTIGGIVVARRFEIYMLYGLPRMHFIATMAHELMHVWLHRNAPEDIDSILCEGSCNYAAFLVLEEFSGPERDFVMAVMRDDPDPVYGEGFRRVAEYVRRNGINSWLAYLQRNSNPPW
jgi:hypothetical protein